ncbi:fungal trichothecene efflux pump [Exophiala viscosa]|uniref:fungal trichothecene efflux pump n=1 Tax=Exophiala viscosa TaxID=2486360 RepID=UPI002197B43D|nr:fungal trichothecene efflux pump [Exophiala viscosa]
MADIRAMDLEHSMKHTAVGTKHSHHENANELGNNNLPSSAEDLEKHPSHGAGYDMSHLPMEDGEYIVTAKTWAVVATLAFSYGISFWPVPFFSTIETQIATQFGSPGGGTWITSVYTLAGAISFMICGANSDLFGRRYFILCGNVLVFIGAILGATSHSLGQTIAAHTLFGFGGSQCQLAAFALPELLPNKWRHFAVVMADGLIFFDVIVGPVAARVAIRHGSAWRWGYWGTAIIIAISFVILLFAYFPPKHPRGIPWDQALKQLDYVGILSFTGATTLILAGIVFVQLRSSSDPLVIGLLVSGFALLVFFAAWETLAPLKEPLTPRRLFTHNRGRSLTAPFIVGFVVTMFYYGTNITWPTMVAVYFTKTTTPFHITLLQATIQGLGIFTGAMLLSFGGSHIKHWKWQMTVPITLMTFFGGMLGYINPERENLGIAFAFLCAMFYGYAQYLSIAYIQFGADQRELGIAGGLAGVARVAGGAIAVTVYETILINVQSSYAAKHVPAAAEAAGASAKVAEAILAALPLGAAALAKVQGATTAMIEAAAGAYTQSYVSGLKTVALASVGFGAVGIIATLFLEDIGPKMTPKIEIFLENDVQAEKNKFH